MSRPPIRVNRPLRAVCAMIHNDRDVISVLDSVAWGPMSTRSRVPHYRAVRMARGHLAGGAILVDVLADHRVYDADVYWCPISWIPGYGTVQHRCPTYIRRRTP